jgi:hypothetical protein
MKVQDAFLLPKLAEGDPYIQDGIRPFVKKYESKSGARRRQYLHISELSRRDVEDVSGKWLEICITIANGGDDILASCALTVESVERDGVIQRPNASLPGGGEGEPKFRMCGNEHRTFVFLSRFYGADRNCPVLIGPVLPSAVRPYQNLESNGRYKVRLRLTARRGVVSYASFDVNVGTGPRIGVELSAQWQGAEKGN